MILKELSVINYKNLREAQLKLSPKINCLVGRNGMGKTNVMDAIYYLSFCRSASVPIDSQVMTHEAPFFVVEGTYRQDDDESLTLDICCGMKRGQKKHFKRAGKEYRRLSEHIGLIPLVMVSPADTLLIEGGSEERRRLMDQVIAQYDAEYIEALNRYNKALQQRNTLLKQEEEPDPEMLALWEEQMAREGEQIYDRRRKFAERLVPIFQTYYERISGGGERVSIDYTSHCERGPLLDVIQRDRAKDRIMGFSLHGIHKDDLLFALDGHPMKREGSQGQMKTFVIALKLAQFDFLRQAHTSIGRGTTPLLLLDDIFDKLDSQRVEQIVRLVGGDDFGQIFITDTNREHLDQILSNSSHDYRIFEVEDGHVQEGRTSD